MARGERRGKPQDAEALGESLAEELLNNGAREILAEVYNGEPPGRHILVTFSRRRAVSEPSARTGAGGLEVFRSLNSPPVGSSLRSPTR